LLKFVDFASRDGYLKKAFDVKKSATSILKILLILQLAYLLVINLALQLPLTQSVVNAIKPEKFHVSWDNAWSWYPFRVHATGIAANGQSRSQQWQFNAHSATGSIAITPLVFKRVWISDVRATDIDYRQRPRLKADKDYRELLPNYPEISGREITFAETAPRKSKRPWHLNIEDMQASGRHSYWIHQFRGTGEGIFKGDLSFETRGGPFSMSGEELDLRLDTLFVNRDQEVFKHAHVAGAVGFAPFVPRDNKGLELLRFLQIDVDVDVDANSLRFVSIFTQNFGGLKIDGSGKVDGRLRFDSGEVLEPTELAIIADDLWAGILGHSITGDGVVNMELGPDTGGLLELLVHSAEDAALVGQHHGRTASGPLINREKKAPHTERLTPRQQWCKLVLRGQLKRAAVSTGCCARRGGQRHVQADR
jgi:hypothetical protein